MSTMFKEVQESKDSEETHAEMPDVLIEHGSTRVSFDLSAFEWVVVAIITAIVGLTVYLVS